MNARNDLDRNSEVGQWAVWLDSREQARTAYLAGLITGKLPISFRGVALAQNYNELRLMALNKSSSNFIIRTADDLIVYTQGNEYIDGPLARLSGKDLEIFMNNVRWADYMEDGNRYRHIISMYFGDLVQKHGFTYNDIFDVLSLFGLSAEYSVRTLHKFGCTVDPVSACQPRMYYNCPSAADC